MSETPFGTSAPKLRCLVIQFARLGDTVQSLMALRAAQQLYPQLEITLVVHENFAEAARRVDWVHEVVTFPTASLLTPILRGGRTAQNTLPEVARWVEPLISKPWDYVVNWSYSEASSFLTGLVPGKVKLGYSRAKDGTFACLDGWSHYIQAVVQSDTEQSIHLTDILTTQLLTTLQIHAGEPADAGQSTVTSKKFFTLDREGFVCEGWSNPSRRWIALQLGASTANKTWSPENWAALVSRVIRRHDEYGVVIVGGKKEAALEDAFFAALETELGSPENWEDRVVSKVGETDFNLWAQILAGAQWVFSADTAAIHVASVLGTRVMNVSVGPVRYAETGPYGNGHYVLRDPTPDSAYAAWTYGLTEWKHRRELKLEEHFARLETDVSAASRVYRSKIRSGDDGGGVHYEPMVERAVSLKDWYSQVLGHLARAWYCGWTPPVGQELARGEISPELIQGLRQLQEGTGVFEQIVGEATRTATRLGQKTRSMKSETIMKMADREEIQTLGMKLGELEALLERVGRTQEPIAVFSRLHKVLMHNLRSEKLSQLSEETAAAYRFLELGTRTLGQWIDHTLSLAKPVAIEAANVIPLGRGAPRPERTI